MYHKSVVGRGRRRRQVVWIIRWRMEAGRGSGRSRMKLRVALPLWSQLWASSSWDWTTGSTARAKYCGRHVKKKKRIGKICF